jgi:hypothetical protein
MGNHKWLVWGLLWLYCKERPTDVPGVFDNTEIAFITIVTGRFAGATGTFDLGGQIDLNTGTFSLPWEGTISTVGSSR